MKKVTICVFLLTMTLCARSQELFNKYYPHTVKQLQTIDEIDPTSFMDSLRTGILLDTVRFSTTDLFSSSLGTTNDHPYSLLFIVDRKYSYLLDIINGNCVQEFCNEFLNDSIVDEISMIGREDAVAIFGRIGRLGAIMIKTKWRSQKPNYKVAGLTVKNGSGNNFYQYKKGDCKSSY